MGCQKTIINCKMSQWNTEIIGSTQEYSAGMQDKNKWESIKVDKWT